MTGTFLVKITFQDEPGVAYHLGRSGIVRYGAEAIPYSLYRATHAIDYYGKERAIEAVVITRVGEDEPAKRPPPDIMKAFAASWEQNEEAYRYLTDKGD